MKQILKRLLCFLHITVTRNQRYDAYTKKILKLVLKHDSNCVDIGCHKGEILDLMIECSQNGKKLGFEPIPELFTFLSDKYSSDPLVTVYPVALYDKAGTTTFQHVVNAPAYSGIKKREYDGKHVSIDQITVETGMLDHFINADLCVDLIKIDVEGAEFHVMKGGADVLRRCKPIVIFEFGLGAADFYNTSPEDVFSFLTIDCGLNISTLKGYLKKSPPLSFSKFNRLFETGAEYYFIGHPSRV
jgi:FkbM family methyltransferase